MTTKCKAQNPNTCRYHGTIHAHRNQLQTAHKEYLDVLRKSLASPSTPESTKLISEADEKYKAHQSYVDAHDATYKELVDRIDSLDEVLEADGEYVDDNFKAEYKELVDRKAKADAIRTKVNNLTRSTAAWRKANPVDARVEIAEHELQRTRWELEAINNDNPTSVQDFLDSIANKTAPPVNEERQKAWEAFNNADIERTNAIQARTKHYAQFQILDRNDPRFLETLRRKGF